MTEISEKAQEEIQKWVKAYPEEWKGGVCAFVLIDRETGAISDGSSIKHGPCHYGIRCTTPRHIVVNAHKPTSQGAFREFTLWVARESPFAHGVLNKDNDDELFNHASVMDGGLVGKGGVLWLCKAWRHTHEEPWKLERWDMLRSEGLDGLQAFVGMDILNMEGKPHPGTTHCSLFGYEQPEALRKSYDRIKNAKSIDTFDACSFLWTRNRAYWGSLKTKSKKVPDGWGGFTEVQIPCCAKEYAAALKEIFEGDPKNVK